MKERLDVKSVVLADRLTHYFQTKLFLQDIQEIFTEILIMNVHYIVVFLTLILDTDITLDLAIL